MVNAISFTLSSFFSALLFIAGFVLGERQSKFTRGHIVETMLDALKLLNDPRFKDLKMNPKTHKLEFSDSTTSLNRT